MKKQFFAKALAVVTAMSMLSSTAFAAVAFDPTQHVGSDGSLQINSEENYDYYLENDIELDKTLIIKDGVDASIDLNGHTLSRYDDVELPNPGSHDGHKSGYSSVIEVKEGSELTVKDTDENGGNDGETGTITGGFALHGGGGVNVNGGTFNLEGGAISGNATYYDGGAGVFVNNGGTFNMSGGEISENSMSTNGVGGGVRVENAEFNMTGGTIANNNAGNGGGVAIKDGSFTMSGEATIDDNFGKNSGGGVYLDSSDGNSSSFVMDGGTISNNTTDGYGGGVAAYPLHNDDGGDRNSFVMNDGAITGNHADNDVGGGVSIRYGDFEMNGGEISDNTAKDLGGGVHSYYANTTINGGTISGNSLSGKDSKGGGVFLFGEENSSSITGGTITNNSSDIGAGVHVDNTSLEMSGGNVDDNHAASYGGGVAVIANGKFDMSGDAKVTNNSSGTYGGGVYLYNGASFTMSDDAALSSNVSKFGGGLFNWSSTFTMNNGEISGNTGTSGGAGVYNFKNATSTMNSGNIINNIGNGVYNYGNSTFNMKDGTISGNVATNGGGVYNNASNFVMTGGKIYNNSAEKSSDDIYSNTKDGGSITLITAEDMGAEINGEAVNRWLWDASNARYEDGNYLIPSLTANAVLCLKAAPAQMFTVTYEDGYSEDSTIESKELDRNSKFPTVDDPTREGWEFTGWGIELPETVTGNITLVAQWTHTAHETATRIENEVAAQIGVPGSRDVVTYCTVCGEELSRETVTIPALEEEQQPTTPEQPSEPEQPTEPDTPDTPDQPDEPTTPDQPGTTIPDEEVPGADEPADEADTISIEDETVPLAGIMTLAQLLEVLRQNEGVEDMELPEDFAFIDHDYAQAIYWGLAEGLVVDTEDEPLDPDAILNVGLLRGVLENFVAVYKEEDLAVDIEGEDDDLVLDLGDRLEAFYEELGSAR